MPAFKYKVKVEFDLSVPVEAYPPGTSHKSAAHLDQLGFSGDTETLLETLCSVPYSVTVEPVET